MKTPRVVASALTLAALLGMFFFLPLPVSRIRQSGVVQIQEGQAVEVNIQISGILKKIHVKEGEHVFQGRLLAEFANPDLEKHFAAADITFKTKEKLLPLYKIQLDSARDPKDKSKLEQLMRSTRADMDAAAKTRDQIKGMMELLVLTAPRAGRVGNPPLADEIGKYWDKDQSAFFCSVGNPDKLSVQVPVNSADYKLLKENWEKLHQGKRLAITIRVQGRAGKTWKGAVVDMPTEPRKYIPPAQATKRGGTVPTKTSADPKNPEAQNKVYLVYVNFLEADDAIAPGALAQVKIHCEYRSCAWWTWRALSQTFNLGLL